MASKSTSKHLECKDLHGYLKTLPPNVLSRLYNHPATCLAIFQHLPTLAKHYVMRVLFVEQPIAQTVIGAWVVNDAHSEHTAAVKVLTELRVWQEQAIAGGLPGWILCDIFRKNLKVALLGGGKPWTGTGALKPDKHAKDSHFLDEYAIERWECVLHYMVGSKEGVSGVSKDVIGILVYSGLMKTEGAELDAYITQAGFQFLLLGTASQVWYFMVQYLETVESRGMDIVECLTFLFQLSFSSLGKDYSMENMSPNLQRFLQHLREFGLVYQRKRSSQRFYPTRLAVNMASGLSEQAAEVSREGYLVVESNYRVYAYTESPLQVALLALFCEMLYRFPNMAVASLTRDSVREALCRGISADQIINYLRSHAHPEMLVKKPILPPTITDQVRLWELERDRFKFSDGVLYNQFLSDSDFELLRDYAKDLGVLVWDNPEKRTMVVTRAGHDDVKRFWKRHRT